jgi:hypothetical protein
MRPVASATEPGIAVRAPLLARHAVLSAALLFMSAALLAADASTPDNAAPWLFGRAAPPAAATSRARQSCVLPLLGLRPDERAGCCALAEPVGELPAGCGAGGAEAGAVAARLDTPALWAQRLLPPRPRSGGESGAGPRFAWLALLGDSVLRQEFEALARVAAAHPAPGAPASSGWAIPYDLKVFVCDGEEAEGEAEAGTRPALVDVTCAPGLGLSSSTARRFIAERERALAGESAGGAPRRALLAVTHEFARGPILLPAAAGYPRADAESVLYFAERILASTNATSGEELPGAAVKPTALVFNPGLHALARNVTPSGFAPMLRDLYLGLEAMLDAQRTPRTRLVQHNIGPADTPRINPKIDPLKVELFRDENIVPLNVAIAAEWRAHAARRAARRGSSAKLLDTYSLICGGPRWEGPTWTSTRDGWHFDDAYARLASWLDLHLAADDGPEFSVGEDG